MPDVNPSADNHPGNETATAPKTSIWRAMGFVPWLALGMAAIVVIMITGGSQGHAAGTGSLHWNENAQASLQQAAASGKPILMDFTADWCPTCQTVNREFYALPEIQKSITEHFVPLKVDLTNQDGPNVPIAVKMGIHLLPAFVVVSPQGREIARFSDDLSAENLRAWLDRVARDTALGKPSAALAPPTTQPG